MSKHVITTIVVAIVIGVVGFFGGMKYGEGKTAAAAPTAATGAAGAGGFAGRAGRGGAFGGAAGGGLVTGQILKQDSNSITVQLPNNGGTKLVLFAPNTTVGRIATGTTADLVTGENVVVTGTANSDGSVSATSIQVRPAGTGGFGGGQASSTPSSNAPMIPAQ